MISTVPKAVSGIADKIVIQSGGKIYFIEVEAIQYIEACNYYALIHAGTRTYVVRKALDDLEQRLKPHSFLRIHRSVILNLNIFQCMEREKNTLMVRTTIGRNFKVSRHRQKVIKERVLTA